ncbi:hypothetical protein GCM10023086_58020 [Streptomyces venetus]|uniref:Uncharacterized protein n=1 Tax=Streptomyces venetus TaxID=1701086 RepID=A0ABP8GRV8_9ACTN
MPSRWTDPATAPDWLIPAGFGGSARRRSLLRIHRSACEDGVGFHLDGVGPVLRRLLEITGTYEYLTGTGDGVT